MHTSAQSAAAHASALSRRAHVQRPGFTILELVIVLTLLIAVTGLVMPSILNRMSDSVSEATIGQIEAAASECRSRSQQEGRALRLIARERLDRSIGLYVERIGTSGVSSGSFDVLESGELAGESSKEFQSDPFERRDGPVYVLPDGYMFSRTPPLEEDALFADPRFEDSPGAEDQPVGFGEGLQDGLELAPLTIAVYLPDGTALAETPLYLIADGRVFTVEFGRWTGGVVMTLVPERRDDEFGFLDEDPMAGFEQGRPSVPSAGRGGP